MRLAKICVLAYVLCASSRTFGNTFSDSLTSGLNSNFRAISTSLPNIYSVATNGAGVEISKTATTNGNRTCNVVLNLAALGGNIPGDFSEQINFSNAVLGASLDQAQLDDGFQDGSLFYNVYDNSSGVNVHVWDGTSINNRTATSLTGGTFLISRTGSTVTGYFNGSSIFSESDSSPLSYIDFRLETQGTTNNDSTSATFNNFSLTASSVPEPASAGILVVGTFGLLARCRRQK